MEFGVSIKPIRSRTGLINDFNFTDIGLGGNLNALSTDLRPTNIGLDDNNVAIGAYDAALPFLLGRYASIVRTNYNYDTAGNAFAPGTGKIRDYRYNEFEVYAQDTWRVRSDLERYLRLALAVLPRTV